MTFQQKLKQAGQNQKQQKIFLQLQVKLMYQNSMYMLNTILSIVSELNGGLIENAKYITFFGVGNLKSPLKNRIYFSQNDLEDVNFGHARCDRYQSMIFPLTQAYEINTLRIRFWDMDDRIHYVQVFTTQKDLSDEVKIYEGQAQGLVSIHFSDQLVQIIRIYSLGNSYDGYMSIIKIQAFILRNKNVI